jgi:hypothetical protein
LQILIEQPEAWSLMSLVTSQIIDGAGLSSEGKAALRQWRTAHDRDSERTAELTDALNEALGNYIDHRTDRMVRKKGRYARKSELK